MEAVKDASDSELRAQNKLQEEALADKTRVAEDRIQTQRDIAALNAKTKGTDNDIIRVEQKWSNRSKVAKQSC